DVAHALSNLKCAHASASFLFNVNELFPHFWTIQIGATVDSVLLGNVECYEPSLLRDFFEYLVSELSGGPQRLGQFLNWLKVHAVHFILHDPCSLKHVRIIGPSV